VSERELAAQLGDPGRCLSQLLLQRRFVAVEESAPRLFAHRAVHAQVCGARAERHLVGVERLLELAHAGFVHGALDGRGPAVEAQAPEFARYPRQNLIDVRALVTCLGERREAVAIALEQRERDLRTLAAQLV